jgi:hypothetical protein
MTFRDAKKLHNGDEVIDKTSGESVNVLSIEVVTDGSYGDPAVIITGTSQQQGYNRWHHRSVR